VRAAAAAAAAAAGGGQPRSRPGLGACAALSRVTSPLPRHEIEEQIYEGRPSPVRWFTLFGALFGGSSGFLVTSLTHANWPMIIPAGKPLPHGEQRSG
jgi:hypothetical protein